MIQLWLIFLPFVVVMALFLYCRYRFRAGMAMTEPSQAHRHAPGTPKRQSTYDAAADTGIPPMAQLPRASYSAQTKATVLATIVITAALVWFAHHLGVLLGAVSYGAVYPWPFTVLFALVAQQIVLSWFDRPFTLMEGVQLNYKIAVIIPVRNEDAGILQQNLYALLSQTYVPSVVYIVVNDTDETQCHQYRQIAETWRPRAEQSGIEVVWIERDEPGKRSAQAVAFPLAGENLGAEGIAVTIDSDSVLDPEALHEIIKPFTNSEVQAVGGINTGINTDKNMLTRLSDLLHIQWQLTARSAQNVAGKRITVNSGRLAAYRMWVVTDHIDAYLSELFMGKPVHVSDDSFLTMIAMQRGLTVQQPTAIAMTWHPENMQFFVSQRVRWMKGWWIRTYWRFRYLPKWSYALLSELMDMYRLMLGTLITVMVLIVRPIFFDGAVAWQLFVVPVVLSYLTSLRYFSVWQSGQSLMQRVFTFATAPITIIWSWLFLRWLRMYAIIKCTDGGWGTRDKVEVTHDNVIMTVSEDQTMGAPAV
ncbi:MAG: glycosyltransferase [Candidatus Saccharimonadaceae bacterium]